MSNVLAVNKVVLVCMQHLITNTSGYGAKYIEDGGVKAQYHMDIKMRIKFTEKWTVGTGENEQCIGLIVHWEIPCSALGMPPDQECVSHIRFGIGIDELKENMDIATSLGIINKAGAWFSFGENKLQGEEKLYKFFLENEDQKELMMSKIKELIS
jgi:recombination protein RecA